MSEEELDSPSHLAAAIERLRTRKAQRDLIPLSTPADWWTPESWQNPAHRSMLAAHVSRLTGASVAELVAAFEVYADQAWAQQTAQRLGHMPDVPGEITQ